MYDVLEEISALSLHLQDHKMTLPKADKLMKCTIRQLSSMKEQPGDKLEEALNAAEKLDFNLIPLQTNPKMQHIVVDY